MVEVRQIPLGGFDAAGNPLPPTGQYLVPGGEPAGPQELGGWAPYMAPEQKPHAQPAEGLGGWASYQQPEQQVPRQVGTLEAAGRGAANMLTFGAAPALTGLAAASGIPAQQPPPGTDPNDFFDPNPVRPIVGAARMVGNYFGGQDQQAQQLFEQARQQALAEQTQAQQQHPYAYLGGQVAGGGATLPVGGSMGAATALGRIAQGARAGAIGGGLTGAGTAASEGEAPIDIAKSAAGGVGVGAGLGGLLGSTIEGVTGAGRKVVSLVRGARDAEQEAGSKVASALAQDRGVLQRNVADQPALQAGTEAGTPLTIMDLGGENTRALMRSAANISPSARETIGGAIYPRFEQQADRIGSWIRSKFGGFDKEADIEAIKAIARKENAPAYRAAYAQGDREIWSPELERLSSAPYVQRAIQGAISKWKNYAVRDGFGAMNPAFRIENGGLIKTGTGLRAFPNIQLWDYAARDLQDRARAAPIGSEQAKLYNDLARMLKEELDAHVPAYKAAREGAAVFFKARDASEAGANFVTDGSISSVQGARGLAKMSPAEKELFRRGFASKLAEQIERTGYNSDVLKSIFVNSPRATQRINIALGPGGAEQFEALLRVEALADRARTALGNSTTVRQAGEAGLAGAGAGAAIESVQQFNPVYLIAGALILGGRSAAREIDSKVATKVAEMLTSTDPAVLQRGYKIVSANPVMREALRRASDIGVRQIINNIGPGGVFAGGITAAKSLYGRAPESAQHGQGGDDAYYQPQAAGQAPGRQ